jgi:hypothetical protein
VKTNPLKLAGIMPPEGLCPTCLREGQWDVHDNDGCTLIALHCPHTGYCASRKIYAAGSIGPWLIAGPINTHEFMKYTRIWSGDMDDRFSKSTSADDLETSSLRLKQLSPV